MMLNDLLSLVTLGAKQPLFLALDEIEKVKTIITPTLNQITDALEDETDTKKQLTHLQSLLSSETVDDFALAQSLSEIAGVFLENTPEDKAELIEQFRLELGRFYKRAQTYRSFQDKREMIGKPLSDTDKLERDKKLATTIGMMYVLEYLLTMHKAIETASDPSEKIRFITSREVKLPEGGFPGLWFDFTEDEILTKFIFDLLTDDMRTKLVESYYQTKNVFMQIQVECDMQGQCSAAYEETQVNQIQSALKQFITDIIDAYTKIGIENLTSIFLSPYGEKTKLTDLPF